MQTMTWQAHHSGSAPTAPIADQAALVRVGEQVQKRLIADPSVHRVDVSQAEIFVVSQFVTPEECSHLMGLIDQVAKPSSVFGPDYAAGGRSSYSGDVDPADSFVRMIERRIADLMGLELAWGEAVQGQRYMPGQEFQHHYDWFNTAADYWPEVESTGGQRSWTAMAFLNDVEEGGETDFNRLGISIPPQQGALAMWNNARPDGTPNPDTMHAGSKVIRGTKYVITKWFRTRRWG
jgi:prolyl 4-hydroxylase